MFVCLFIGTTHINDEFDYVFKTSSLSLSLSSHLCPSLEYTTKLSGRPIFNKQINYLAQMTEHF